MTVGTGEGGATTRRRAYPSSAEQTMLRAIFTIIAMSLVVVFVGGFALVVGLVYPSRRLVAICSLIWARVVLYCSGTQLTVVGKEMVVGGSPRFYMGNHQSALDIPILVAALGGDVRFLAKNTLFYIPIFGWAMSRYGYVPVHRGDARTTHRCLEVMLRRLRRNPVSFAVFPEGTRSRDGRLLTFRRGTMKIAQRSGFDVVPFSIEGSAAVHHRDRLLRAVPGPVTLVFGQAIPAAEIVEMSSAELQRRVVAMVAGQMGLPVEPPLTQDRPALAEATSYVG